MIKNFQDITIYAQKKDFDFNSLAIEVYQYQKKHNPIYRRFIDIIGQLDRQIDHYANIPFAPISLFKSLEIKTGNWPSEALFKSSGTMGGRSTHHVKSIEDYHQNTAYIFESIFGSLNKYQFISLLPNYQTNPHSSLISMVEYFMKGSQYEGLFCVDSYDLLHTHIEHNKKNNRPTVVFGVSFALLEYADRYGHHGLSNVIVIETGGMKKFRKEVTRGELHDILSNCFSQAQIVSEYGMSECLSQLYAEADGRFEMNNRMRVVLSEPTDPFSELPQGQKGRINIIDLANISTLSFIATDDIGSFDDQGRLDILGRIDNSDLRGCNYLI